MAHWAQIDDTNRVIRVTVGSNEDIDEGYQWLVDNLGGNWLKTSYNTRAGVHILGGTPFRGNYAGVGYTYDAELDAFLPPKPFDSWTVNVETFSWEAPIPYPADGGSYEWDEASGDWLEVS